MPFVIRSLVKSLLILIVFVPVMAALPLAAIAMTRTPEGAVAWFFVGPWSAGFYVLVYSQISATPWRQGAAAVREWREANGGLLHTSFFACGWMFGAIFFSYVAEFALVLAGIHSRSALPLATFSPLLFAWLWRKTHG